MRLGERASRVAGADDDIGGYHAFIRLILYWRTPDKVIALGIWGGGIWTKVVS